MPKFEFSGQDVLIDGVSTSQVAQVLQQSGIHEHKIGELLGYWYWGATGSTKPAPFDFTTDVEETDPDCAVTYERTFEHVDWVDGEDRVQAAATPEELGFNARFHAIENEFDAIAAQFQGLGRCAADLRADLVGVVKELESKITALQNDIYDLRQETKETKPSTGGVIGTVKVGEKEAFITNFNNNFHLLEFEGDLIGRSPVVERDHYVGGSKVFEAEKVRPEDVVDLYAGVEEVLTQPAFTEILTRGEVTVADLRGVAGGVTLPTGESFASVIAHMPADQRLKGTAGAVEAIGAHIAAALPQETAERALESVVADESLRTGSAARLRNAKATNLGVSAQTSDALSKAGVESVSALSKTTTKDLVGLAAAAGADVNVTEMRAAVARARVATMLHGRTR